MLNRAAVLLPRSSANALRPLIHSRAQHSFKPSSSRHLHQSNPTLAGVHVPSSSKRKSASKRPNHTSRRPGPFKTSQDAQVTVINALLLDLRSALVSKDLEASWSAWNRIASHGISQQISTQDHNALIQLLHNVLPGLIPNQRRAWLDRCQQCASSAADSGDIAIVKHWAKLFLQYDRPEFVSILVKQSFQPEREKSVDLVDQASDSDPLTPPSSGPQQTDSDSALDTTPADTSVVEGRVRIRMSAKAETDLHDLLACLIIANSVQNDLPGLVQAFESAVFGSLFGTFFQEARVLSLYESLGRKTKQKSVNQKSSTASKDAGVNPTGLPHESIKDRITLFCRHAELSRGLSTGLGGSQRIARLLGSLFSSRKTESAWVLFLTAMEASAGNQAWLPIEDQSGSVQSSSRDTNRAAWTQSCWSVCLSNFLATGKLERASKVWSTYHERGFKPSHRMWNALLDGYSRSGSFDAVYKTWKELKSRSEASEASSKDPALQPDAVMYTTMISTLIKDRRLDEAMQIFAEMKQRHDSKSDPLQIPPETFNAVMHGLFVTGRPAEASALLTEMREKGPQPTIGTINTILRANGRIGDLTALANCIRMINQLKLTPDVVTFTTILDALLRKAGSSASDSVLGVLKLMDSLNVKANAVTYTALIKACLVSTEASNVDLAVQNMAIGRKRNAQNAGQAGSGFMEPRFDAALDLLDRMISLRVEPTEVTYSTIIAACLQNPEYVAAIAEKGGIPEQYLSGPRPRADLGETPETVARWRRDTPAVTLALNLLERLRKRGLSPNSTTFHYLIAGLGSPVMDRASFLRALVIADEAVDTSRRASRTDGDHRSGPFISSALQRDYRPVEFAGSSAGALGYRTWVVILGTICERLERYPADRGHRQECIRALNIALELIRESHADSARGTDGGSALARIMDRARALIRGG